MTTKIEGLGQETGAGRDERQPNDNPSTEQIFKEFKVHSDHKKHKILEIKYYSIFKNVL